MAIYKNERRKLMERDYLEMVKEIMGTGYMSYLQNRLEEAVHYGDAGSVSLVGQELVSGFEELLSRNLDEETRGQLLEELEVVKGNISSATEDRGQSYLLDDGFIEALEGAQVSDEAWQTYVMARASEADNDGDYANYVFLVGKYLDSLEGAYGDEPEIAERISEMRGFIDEVLTSEEYAGFEKAHPEVSGMRGYAKASLFIYANPGYLE